MLKSAVGDEDPVIFIEDMMLYFAPGGLPDDDYLTPNEKKLIAAVKEIL